MHQKNGTHPLAHPLAPHAEGVIQLAHEEILREVALGLNQRQAVRALIGCVDLNLGVVDVHGERLAARAADRERKAIRAHAAGNRRNQRLLAEKIRENPGGRGAGKRDRLAGDVPAVKAFQRGGQRKTAHRRRSLPEAAVRLKRADDIIPARNRQNRQGMTLKNLRQIDAVVKFRHQARLTVPANLIRRNQKPSLPRDHIDRLPVGEDGLPGFVVAVFTHSCGSPPLPHSRACSRWN